MDIDLDLKKQWRSKDGKLIHDGDCFFWDRHVCTCGLIHALIPYRDKGTPIYRGDLDMDEAQQRHVMDFLLRNRPEPLVPISEEEAIANIRWLEEQFGFRPRGD